jgi:hypothetical protein
MAKSILIARRFCGPPDSGNGGYTCGLVAEALGGPSEIMLRMPIPIERVMHVEMLDTMHAHLKSGDDLVAEGARSEVALGSDLPRVDFDLAGVAAEKSPAFRNHPFPTCFVCGPQRAAGDGLRIFPGAIEGAPGGFDHLFAAPWIPEANLADDNGRVRDEFVWAALDCPTGFAGGFPYEGKLVTGRLAARLLSPVRAGEKCTLVSWRTGVDGRKHHAAAVLLGADGEVHAQAKATWIKLQ